MNFETLSRAERPIRLASRLSRMTLALAVVIGTGGSALAVDAGMPQTGEQPSGEAMVAAFHSVFGARHVRATHAKGILVVGSFAPSASAAEFVKAPLFKTDGTKVLARFSDFTGIPDISDTEPASNPRGLALKFTMSDGASMDVVTHNFNGFPAANAEEFRQLLLAIAASGPTAPKPTRLDAFLDSHPAAKTFLTTQKKPSVSYASISYFGVNAFKFTAADGKIAMVRYRLVPVSGEELLTDAAFAAAGPNYLSEELPKRLARAPAAYRWLAQIAEPGDGTDDPSQAWPETRQLVELGTITLTRIADASDATDSATLFMPTNVPDGITPIDPMLSVREAAYPVSFGERQ